MPKDSLKKYCSIHKFLEQQEPELYELFDNACMLHILRPKFTTGVTLLIPDASYKKQIASAVFGPDPEEAVPMLQSIVIQDYLPTSSSWMSKKDDIPNALKQKVEVESADENKVKLASGATLTRNKAFAAFSTRENLAVWNMSGEIPLDAPPATYKYARKARTPRNKSKTRGEGAVGSAEHCCEVRVAIAKKIEGKFAQSLRRQGDSISKCYLESAASLLIWLHYARPEVFNKIKKYVDWCPMATFYILLEPHSTSATLITDDVVEAWFNETRGKIFFPKAELLMHYQKIMDIAARDTTESVLNSRKNTQSKLLTTQKYKPVLAKEALKEYGNRIADAFRDELRFILCTFVQDIYEIGNPVERCDIYVKNVLTHVRYLYKDTPTTNDCKALMCLNQEHQNLVDTRSWISSTYAFVRSDAFLYVPISSKMISDPSLGITTITEQDVTCDKLINLSGMKYNMLMKTPIKERAPVELKAAIDAMNKA